MNCIAEEMELKEYRLIIDIKNDRIEEAIRMIFKVSKYMMGNWYYMIYGRRFPNLTYITVFSEVDFDFENLGFKYNENFNFKGADSQEVYVYGKRDYSLDRQNESASQYGGPEAKDIMFNYFYGITGISLELLGLNKNREEISITLAGEVFKKFGATYKLFCNRCGNKFQPLNLLINHSLVSHDIKEDFIKVLDATILSLKELAASSILSPPHYSIETKQYEIFIDLAFQYSHIIFFQFGKSPLFICPKGHTVCVNPGYANFPPPWRR